MKYQNGSVSDLKIAYIGGGSRGWAWGFMADLAMEPELNGTVRLYDIDAQAAKNNETIGNHLSSRPEVKSNWKYETASSLKVALTDADFVIISILPGTFDEMASDVHLPERLGIYQSVGDTAGPGGMIRALRTIPMFVEIAQAIKAYSPNAWVINYTNPMTLCVKTLYHVFPKIKAFGCCHEVFGTQKVLKGILEKSQGLENVKRSDIHVNVLGINHFTWFDYASYQGMDLMPIYRDYVEEHFEEGFDEQDKNWANSTFECTHRVKFDLFRKYGLIAAAGDRHLAEFMPGNEYLKNPETVTSWKFGLTTVDWRKTDLEKRLERSKKLVSGEEEMKLDASGEEGILLIKALCGLTRVVSNVNIPNTSKQITNLPSTAVVETNAVFERDSIRPVIAGTLPKEIHDLIAPHVENHEDILKASLNYDKDLVIRAFLNDPLIKDRCSKEEVALLVRDMIKATLAYLPKEWKELI
jgi:alpha-galactosidase